MDLNAKRQFIKTALNEGIEEARQEYVNNHINMITVTRENPYAEIWGKSLHCEEIKRQYPGIPVIKVRSNHIKSLIDEI